MKGKIRIPSRSKLRTSRNRTRHIQQKSQNLSRILNAMKPDSDADLKI